MSNQPTQWPQPWAARPYGTPEDKGWKIGPTETWGENVLLIGQKAEDGRPTFATCATAVAMYNEKTGSYEIDVEYYLDVTPEEVVASDGLHVTEHETIKFGPGWATHIMENINRFRAIIGLEKFRKTGEIDDYRKYL